MNPDQLAGLGSLAFLTAIGMCLWGLYLELVAPLLIETAGVLPVAEPAAPIVHPHPSGVFGTSCKVPGCAWAISSTNPDTVAEQADLHRHQHIAAHARRVVRDLGPQEDHR